MSKYQFKTDPYEHQREGLRRSWRRAGFAYLMEMGTGKSKVMIDEMSIYWENLMCTAAVVLAPKGVYLNWIREINTHMPDRVREQAVVVEWRAGGGSQTHQRRLERLLRPGGLPILLMNLEALSSGNLGYRYLQRFLDAHQCYMAVDESTFIKNHGASRTRRVMDLRDMATWRRIATGSPVTRSPLDLYSQFEFLDPAILRSRSYFAFRARYAVMRQIEVDPKKTGKKRKVNLVVGYRNLEILQEKIASHSYRVRKEECLDLPDKVYETRDVDLTNEQQRAYVSMRDQAIAMLGEESFVSATAVITQLMALQRITCGHVKNDDGDLVELPTNRVRALTEILDETAGKVIIWSRYRHDIQTIVDELERRYGEGCVAQYHGGNTNTRQQDAERFLEDPVCRFMVSNPQSGGYGNTWTVATTVVYYSNDYDLEKRMQSEDRAHRAGQTQSVTYVDLVARGTVDEKILEALRKKMNIADLILQDGYKNWVV